MKTALLVMALLGLATSVTQADPTDLEGGVFIVHFFFPYACNSIHWDDPCYSLNEYCPVTGPGQVVNRVDTNSYELGTWCVLAAWYEDKLWSGVEFGLGDYDPEIFNASFFEPCYPHPDGTGIEISTAGWPGPNEGVIITADTPWSGNYIPVYQFTGYAYGYGAPGVIPLSPHPVTGFAGTLDTLEPPGQHAAVCLGRLGVNTPGLDCEPMAPSAIQELPPPPAVQLLPCYPNPTTGVTLISYELPADQAHPVRLKVYDATGRLVRELVDTTLPGGRYLAYWNGTDHQDRPEPGGLYFVQLTTGNVTQRTGVILVR